MSRNGQIRPRRTDGPFVVQDGEWQASGIVKKISEGTVELDGKYDSSSFQWVVGRPAMYELEGTAEALSGYLVGAANVSVAVSLRRVK